jgi:hypothetical protein
MVAGSWAGLFAMELELAHGNDTERIAFWAIVFLHGVNQARDVACTERKQCAIKQSNRKRYQRLGLVRITKTFEVKADCTLCRKYTGSDERCAAYLQNFRHKEKNYRSFRLELSW